MLTINITNESILLTLVPGKDKKNNVQPKPMDSPGKKAKTHPLNQHNQPGLAHLNSNLNWI